jgi:hypothetical protein
MHPSNCPSNSIQFKRFSLRRALGLAEIVDRLGGECSDTTAADQMGNKVGGAFKALIGAAVKYNLVSYSKGQIKTEPFYQDYKLAYSEDQKAEALRRAFLNVRSSSNSQLALVANNYRKPTSKS